MRAYSIEDLSPVEFTTVTKALEEAGFKAPIEDMYFFELPDSLLSETQREHDGCGPFVLALETGMTAPADAGGTGWLKLELLVRGRARIRCECICYAGREQREAMIDFLDAFVHKALANAES